GCREGFGSLFAAGRESALEKLGSVFAKQGANDPTPREDEIEFASKVRDDGLDELYRTGTVNILEHRELSVVARIRGLLNWTGFWLVLAQHSRASASLSRPPSNIICDCGAPQAQLRRASQRCLKDMQALIVEAA